MQRHGALVVLAAVLAVAALTLDGFLSLGNLNHIAVGAAFPAIIALGMTFVIITGGIDLSVGTVFALAGVLAAWASVRQPGGARAAAGGVRADRLAGLAGALNAVWLGSGATIFGIGIELDAISAVVIGGTLLASGYGFVSGSLMGVLLLNVIQNIINAIGGLSSAYQQVVSGAFLVAVVLAQNYLSRRRHREAPPPV